MASTNMGEAKDWTAIAPSFNKMNTDGPGVYGANATLDHVNPLVPFATASFILDMGCGPGQVIGQTLARCGSIISKDARLVAADVSEGMSIQVQTRKKKEIENGHDIWSRVETPIWNAMDMNEVQDNSISHFLSGFVYFLLPEPRKGLKEALRTLKPGGIFAATSMAKTDWGFVTSFIKTVRPDKQMPNPFPTWMSEDGVRGEFEAAGFTDVQAHTVEIFMPFESHEAIIKWIISTFPMMKGLMADMLEADIAKATDMMVDYVKKKHPVAPGRLEGSAILGIGRK